MKPSRLLPSFPALLALTLPVAIWAATYPPANLSDVILTTTPSVATGTGAVTTVFSTRGQALTVGTGGSLTNPAPFDYAVTGPNTASITMPATASGTTGATTTDLMFTGENAGTYTSSVDGGATTTGSFTLEAIPFSTPIANVSVRSTLAVGGSTTLGFVVTGSASRRVVIRAIGPGLTALGVPSPLSNPMLTLYRGNQPIASNSDWGALSPGMTASTSTGAAAATGVGATTSTGSASTTGSTGVAVATTSTGISAAPGNSATTASSEATTGTSGTNEPITAGLATNDLFMQVGAFPLAVGSKDTALVATLPPGPYTVLVTNDSAASAAGTVSGGVATGSTIVGPLSSLGSATNSMSAVGTAGLGAGATSSGSTTASSSLVGNSTVTGSSTSTTPTSGVTTTNASGDVLVEVYFIQ